MSMENKDKGNRLQRLSVGAIAGIIVAAVFMILALFKSSYNETANGIFLAILGAEYIRWYLKTKNVLGLVVGIAAVIGLVASIVSYLI